MILGERARMSMQKPLYSSEAELDLHKKFETFLNTELRALREDFRFSSMNFALFVKRQDLARFLFFHHLYTLIMTTHGIVVEMGVNWGGGVMASFGHFRAIYEPYNFTRRIVGFDTFSGFPSIDAKDKSVGGRTDGHKVGDFRTCEGWENQLRVILDYHQNNAPAPHLEKYELVKGDVMETLPVWLKDNPHVVISCVYFDLDLYKPTRLALELFRDRLPRGAVIGFDEICMKEFPGETVALLETLGVRTQRLQRVPYHPWSSYAVVD